MLHGLVLLLWSSLRISLIFELVDSRMLRILDIRSSRDIECLL
jgi:hypothetical protein